MNVVNMSLEDRLNKLISLSLKEYITENDCQFIGDSFNVCTSICARIGGDQRIKVMCIEIIKNKLWLMPIK